MTNFFVSNVQVPCEPNDINDNFYLVHFGKGMYEKYLRNIDYTIVLEGLNIQITGYIITGGKHKGFIAKYSYQT